jgi:hypothetical protein
MRAVCIAYMLSREGCEDEWFAKAGRSASLRDGWRASFDIQAFIQEQLLGGSWLVSSLVGMPIGMARTNTVYPHMVHHVFVLFPLPRRDKRGMTCPQGQVVFGQVEEFSGPATHVSNHQSCQKNASGTDPSQSGSVAAIRTCRDRVRLRVCRRRPHSPHLPQPHTRHRLNRQL